MLGSCSYLSYKWFREGKDYTLESFVDDTKLSPELGLVLDSCLGAAGLRPPALACPSDQELRFLNLMELDTGFILGAYRFPLHLHSCHFYKSQHSLLTGHDEIGLSGRRPDQEAVLRCVCVLCRAPGSAAFWGQHAGQAQRALGPPGTRPVGKHRCGPDAPRAHKRAQILLCFPLL